MSISLFAYVTPFPEQLYFRRSCFFGPVISLEHLHFRGALSSEQWLLLGSYLFSIANLFRANLLPSRHFLRMESSLGHLLFRTATFLEEELFRIKISSEELLFEAGTSAQRQLFQKSYNLEKKNFLGKAILRITYFFWRATFLERLLFQKTLPPIAATFPEKLIFLDILFQKSCNFTATLPFHRYTSNLSVRK